VNGKGMSPAIHNIKLRDVAVAYAYSIVGWCAYALLMASQEYVIMRSMYPDAAFTRIIRVPLIRAAAMSLLTPLVYYAVQRWPFTTKGIHISILRYLALAAGFIAGFSVIRWLLYPNWDVVHKHFVTRTFDSLLGLVFGGFADQIVVFLLTVLVAHAWMYHRRSQEQSLKQSNLQRELAELQLQLLQMQLHPHFIFNTLHGITTLMERDVDTARTMLLHLADLLRAAISSQSQDLIPLKQELSFITSYIALEQMRLESRLRIDLSVEEAASDILVPHMILQPIVENAILHGAAASRSGGWVNISCRIAESETRRSVMLEVTNSTSSTPARRTHGLGLRNTRARLRNLFEEDAQLEFGIQDGIATARIEFPVLTAQQEATVQ
jgi:two-component system, LytTR family, sensor kinase